MPKLVITYRDLKSLIARRDLNSVLYNRLLQAEAVLDPDTKNRYFRSGHEATMTDLYTSAFSKLADSDSFSFADSNLTDFSALKTDSFSFSDTPSVVTQFNRSFADAFALDDFTAVDAVVKDMANAKTNVFGFGDVQAFGVGKGLADSFTFSDAFDSFGIEKGLTDTQSMTESLARTVQYSRIFTDTFVMDDAATVDALQKATSALKQNIVSMGDLFGRTVIFNRQFTDSVTPTEDHAVSFSKPATDLFTVSEALARTVQYSRTFNDTFVMDDSATVDALEKATSALKQNIFSMGDVFGRTVVFNRQFTDIVTPTEDHAVSFSKSATDLFTVSEVLSRAVTYNRAFSDSQGFGDAVDDYFIAKGLSDTQTMTEAHASSASLGKTDSYSLVDAPAQSFDKPAADSFSLSESLARTVTYNRTFTDAFSMDDAATVNALIKDHANAKTNVFGFADIQAFGFSKAATDTFSFADDEDIEFGKGLSDSVSMTENFSFALFSNAAMNAAQLNLSPFNE